MITCPKCSKENQDHYKFCLGCGAELPRDGTTPKKFAPGTPPHGVAAVKAPKPITDEITTIGVTPAPARPALPPVAVPAPVAPAAFVAPGGAPPIICPQCEHANPANNKFCAACGLRLARPLVAPDVGPVAAPSEPKPSGVVLTALRADGSEAGAYPLPMGTATIGRDTGAIFAGDSYLSPRHATFTPRGGKLFVRDEGSLNGVYKKLRRDEPAALNAGDIFRIGQELIRFEALNSAPPTTDGVERLGSPCKGYVGRIALIIGRDVSGNAFPVPETGLHLGRERGDVLFPEDGYVSGLHCRLAPQGSQLFLTDLGSSNGSFVRIRGETEVADGDVLLMGQQLFKVKCSISCSAATRESRRSMRAGCWPSIPGRRGSTGTRFPQLEVADQVALFREAQLYSERLQSGSKVIQAWRMLLGVIGQRMGSISPRNCTRKSGRISCKCFTRAASAGCGWSTMARPWDEGYPRLARRR